jgi:hypothetical protein
MGRLPKLIPLKDAPWAFASQRLRDEWYAARKEAARRAKSKSGSAEFEIRKKRATEDPVEAFKLAGEAFSDLLETVTAGSMPYQDMIDSLLQKFEVGKLEACGVQSAPKQKRQLEAIPEHFFVDAKISWNGNKVTNFGVTYNAVRVRRRSSIPPGVSLDKALVAPSREAMAGIRPPGVENAATQALVKRGPIYSAQHYPLLANGGKVICRKNTTSRRFQSPAMALFASDSHESFVEKKFSALTS